MDIHFMSTIIILGIMVHMVLWPEATRSSIYSWLEFVTTYIPVLAMCGYMACSGSSWLYVGMSDRPKWNSLLGVNWDKILYYLSYSWWISTWPGQTQLLEKCFGARKEFLVEVMFYQELNLRWWGHMIEAIRAWLNRDSSQYRDLVMKGYLVHGNCVQ